MGKVAAKPTEREKVELIKKRNPRCAWSGSAVHQIFRESSTKDLHVGKILMAEGEVAELVLYMTFVNRYTDCVKQILQVTFCSEYIN